MLAVLLFSPVVIFLIHLVLSRYGKSASPQVTAFKAVLAGYLPVVLFLVLLALDGREDNSILWTTIYILLVYSALGYTYFHFFNMSESARRIRILSEIHRCGPLTKQNITDMYRSSDIVRVRLRRMVAMNTLAYRDGQFVLNDRTLYRFALIIAAWRGFLRLDRRYVDRERGGGAEEEKGRSAVYGR